MTTTIEISDALLREARKLAGREGVTFRALAERGLHRVVAEIKSSAPFRLRRASFKGKVLQAGFRDASWEVVRDAAYRDRGGDRSRYQQLCACPPRGLAVPQVAYRRVAIHFNQCPQ